MSLNDITLNKMAAGRRFPWVENKPEDLVPYVFQYRDPADHPFVVYNNIRQPGNVQAMIEEFDYNCRTYTPKRVKVLQVHEVLSFEKGKKVDMRILEDIARKYISIRCPNAIVISVPHLDKNHVHLHFCISGVNYKESKGVRLSDADFRRVNREMEEYQLEKGITHSIVFLDKDRERKVPKGKYASQNREYEFKRRTEGKVPTQKETASRIVQECFNKSTGRHEFYDLLLQTGEVELRIRGGQITGVRYKNKVYRWDTLEVDPAQLDRQENKEIEKRKAELRKIIEKRQERGREQGYERTLHL